LLGDDGRESCSNAAAESGVHVGVARWLEQLQLFDQIVLATLEVIDLGRQALVCPLVMQP
jgi:hypothetical protein